ncbi:hypothetical protein KCMC57_64250 (plasmid) [Kitasatospora sp. CMC57]|uniref:Uncharacterized protein n=1 Tax=Kitasatospora sp. CMC57 TaxID=3231513 RepID=A0AB33K5L4_9ACTN
MRRALRPSDFPLITKLLGGRVNHMALQLPGNVRVRTACGHIGLPASEEPHTTCQGCILAFTPSKKEHP